MSVALTPRLHCHRCHKPQLTCVCASIRPVKNRTSVLVLQHPRERLHPIGTARFASLGLCNARVHVAWDASRIERRAPTWLPQGTALLYPSPEARDLRELSVHERPRQLLVLDGTWHTARTLYRDKLWLRGLPRYRLLPARPGRYRLRREPQHDYVSTIEAIVEALSILEPDTTGLDGLLAAFDAMIDRQLALKRPAQGRVRKRRRPESERRTPRALIEDFERLMVVYGESSRPRDEADREFVYFCAVAPASGRSFERLIRPAAGLPDAEHRGHMGLPLELFSSAISGSEFRDAWREFLGAGPAPARIAAWNSSTLDLLARISPPPAAPLPLKSAYRALFGKGAPGIEAVVLERGLTPEPNTFRGRAAARLGSALAVAHFLHARARAIR